MELLRLLFFVCLSSLQQVGTTSASTDAFRASAKASMPAVVRQQPVKSKWCRNPRPGSRAPMRPSVICFKIENSTGWWIHMIHDHDTTHKKKTCIITNKIIQPNSRPSNIINVKFKSNLPDIEKNRRCHCYPFLVPLLPCSPPFKTPAIAMASSGHGFAQSVKLMDLSWGTSSRAFSRPRFDVLIRGKNIRDIMRYHIFIKWYK